MSDTAPLCDQPKWNHIRHRCCCVFDHDSDGVEPLAECYYHESLRTRLADAQNELEAERRQRHFTAKETEKVVHALKARLAEADNEATVLVVAMADQFGAPDNWKPLPDLAGKITQISNLAAGLRARLAEAERALERIAYFQASIEHPPLKSAAEIMRDIARKALTPDSAPAAACNCNSLTLAWPCPIHADQPASADAARKFGEEFVKTFPGDNAAALTAPPAPDPAE